MKLTEKQEEWVEKVVEDAMAGFTAAFGHPGSVSNLETITRVITRALAKNMLVIPLGEKK